MSKTAIIIVLPEWPSKGTGGPLGFSFLHVASIVERLPPDMDLYVLATGYMQLVRVDSKETLISLADCGFAQRQTLKGKLIKHVFRRLPYSRSRRIRNGFTRFRQRRRKTQQAQIRGLLSPLTTAYDRIVCHVHDIETGDKLAETCATFDKITLLYSEHGKGGLAREYEQLVPGVDSSDRQLRWLQAQYPAVLNQASLIVFPSRGAFELFEEGKSALVASVRNKTIIVRSGITICPFHPVQTFSPPRIFSIAQHVPEKGLDRILRALSRCRMLGLSLSLRVAGAETVISPMLFRLRDELGLQDCVEFLGAIPHSQIQEELRNCGLYLAAPRVVVFDLSLLEAMAAGRAIVTSRLPGNIEALGESYEGFFENEDQLAMQIESLLTRHELAERLGKANRARCEEYFSLDKMGEQYLELYSQATTGLSQHLEFA